MEKICWDFPLLGTGNESDKCQYVTGPFDKVIVATEPDMVFYPFITDEIWKLVKLVHGIVIQMANFGVTK